MAGNSRLNDDNVVESINCYSSLVGIKIKAIFLKNKQHVRL
jgi:hypothetical protein